MALTDMLLTAICDSASKAPPMIRIICHIIAITVGERFPNAKYTAVGAFIFLRFFCPVIVSPESLDSTITNDAQMYRGFLLAGKLVQNLANNVLFGAKEPYMVPFNDFLTSNAYRIMCFMRDLSEGPLNSQVEPLLHMEADDFALLHHILIEMMDNMSRILWTSWTGKSSSSSAYHVDFHSVKVQFDRLAYHLARLGTPKDLTPPKGNEGDYFIQGRPLRYSNNQYIEFMRQNGGTSIQEIASRLMFYEGGRSKAGRPVMYFILRRMKLDQTRYESVLYYVFKLLEQVSVEPFELLLDYTMFDEKNNRSSDISWLNRLIALTPFEISHNLEVVYGFNPNSCLCACLDKDLPKSVRSFLQRTIFVTSVSALHHYIKPSELSLPKLAEILQEPPLVHLHSLHRISPAGRRIAITLKLGRNHVQMITTKKQKISEGVSSVLVDVFDIMSIHDICLGLASDTETDFRFKYQQKTAPIICVTPFSNDASRFVFVLKNMKSQCEASESAAKTDYIKNESRIILPESVPGIFTNVALFNMCVPLPELRVVSYRLLCALGRSFGFRIADQLMDAKVLQDICIPGNDRTAVIILSTKLAITEDYQTLDVWREWFVGMRLSEPATQYSCIDYIVPWIPNLGKMCQRNGDEAIIAKSVELLDMLAEITYSASSTVRELLFNKIWGGIAAEVVNGNYLIDLALDALLRYSESHGGIGSTHTEVMAGAFVGMFNAAVCNKVVSRLNRLLNDTAFSWRSSLVNHTSWRMIMIHLRFILMANFDYRGPLRNFIPEVAHAISLTAGLGSTLERETVHSLMINMKQCICVSEPLQKEALIRMQHRLELTANRNTRLLYGLTKDWDAFTFTLETTSDTVDRVPLGSVEQIVTRLLKGITTAAPTADIANAWRARWLSLATSVAFQLNPAVQQRAFIEIGCLAGEGIDDDLIYQILTALSASLKGGYQQLTLAIVICLCNTVSSFPPQSRYLTPLFWVAISLIQIEGENDESLLGVSMQLAIAILQTLDERKEFSGHSTMADTLLAARRAWPGLGAKLDAFSGVNFESYFSFAIVTLFLNVASASRHNSLIEMRSKCFQAIEEFLRLELKLAGKITPHALGYIAGILVKNPGSMDISLLAEQDRMVQILFLAHLTYQLDLLDGADNSKTALYQFLADAALKIPQAFAFIYNSLASRMNREIATSNDPELLKAMESIIIAACAENHFMDKRRYHKALKYIVEELGFWTLGGGHNRQRRGSINHIVLTIDIVNAIIT
ncbi:hypothetical protein BX666DRAFT_2124450 [Dichotomocladium elegans]|nr:hypothetical protein BX666DRAFT_2124450 [Dichotomocladium elegans]